MNGGFEYQIRSPMRLLRLILRTLLLVACLPNARAQQLQWESEEMKFSPTPTDTTVVGHFKFKNSGSAEAQIASVNSSCSCTKITLEKRSFAPGESGEIMATFTIGVRTGLQEKLILVESNDPERPRTVLKMKVAIPEVAQLRPTFLYWPSAEPLSAKEIILQVKKGFPVKTVTVESSNPKVLAKVEAAKPGEEYRIIVTPSETDQPVMANLSIKTDYPPEKPKTFYATVRVLPKK